MKLSFMHGVTSVMENISSSHWSQMACYDTTAVERWFVRQEVEMVQALSLAVAAKQMTPNLRGLRVRRNDIPS